jgi:hypothetical protein
MPIHQARGSLRRPNGGSLRIRRDTNDCSDDDFRDLRKIANLIDSHRVRLKKQSRVRGVANLRHPQPNSPSFVYVLFLVVSVQVADPRHT